MIHLLQTISDAAPILSSGGIVILPTDTIYGIVGQALQQSTVERIYQVKQRTPTKPFIILISSFDDIAAFDVSITPAIRQRLEQYWPGPVSVILDCPGERFSYLHRDSHSLAFRMPAKGELRELIQQVGPLVAPSANPEGLEPSRTIDDATTYFGDLVDGYLEGPTNDKPSRIIQFDGDTEIIIRP